jgi:4-amino-4-deoxy-L-arabinose transferase-like glycosyltransferase
LIALLVVASLHLVGLGVVHLLEPDEGRYADVARSFLEGGSLVVPRADFVPFLDKPPLVCWLGALSMRAFGQDATALRLVPALAGILAAAVAGWLARLCSGRGAWAAILVYGTAPLTLGVGRTFTLDVPLTALTGLGTLLVLRGAGVFDERRRSHLDALLGGVALGLATLTKGPVALGLAGLAVIAALAFAPSRRLFSPLPWLVALAVAAPWYVLVSQELPDFARAFFLEENLRRFAGRPTEHIHGPFFFLLTLGWGLGAGTLAGAVLLATGPPLSRGARVLVAWAALVVAFFSLSSTKVETYILPALPPLAAVIGAELEIALDERRGPVWRMLRLTAPIIVGGLAVAVLVGAYAARETASPLLAFLPLGGIAFGAFIAWRSRHREALLVLAATPLLALPLVSGAVRELSYERSSECAYDLVADARRTAPGLRVASYHYYYRGLPFFLGEPVTLLGELNEMRPEAFASRPDLYMPDMFLGDLWGLCPDDCWTRAFLASERPLLVVMPTGQRRPQRFLDACARAGVRAEPRGQKGEEVVFEVVR